MRERKVGSEEEVLEGGVDRGALDGAKGLVDEEFMKGGVRVGHWEWERVVRRM